MWKEEVSSFEKVQSVQVVKKGESEKRIEELTKLVIDSESETLKRVYEKQIESIAREVEDIEGGVVGDLDFKIPYRTAIDKADKFLKSPYTVWKKLSVREQHSLFFFIFDTKIPYDINEGYRTDKIPSAVRLFEEFATTNSHDVETGGIEPPCKRVFSKNLQGLS